MPTCEDWILNALAQLEVSGRDFSRLVGAMFWALDERSGRDQLRVDFSGEVWASSVLDLRIALLRRYMNDSRPIPREHVALFAHETIHQTQTPTQRMSVWGEAQGYIFQALVLEEMGGRPDRFLADIRELALDMTAFGFTTWDPVELEQVRGILLGGELRFNFWYWIEPVLPLYHSRPQSRCGPFGP
jgi:hypothetical protein